jgi:hypothetical protein
VTVSLVLPTVKARSAETPFKVNSTVVVDASNPGADALIVYAPKGNEGTE